MDGKIPSAPVANDEYVDFTIDNPLTVQSFEEIEPEASGIDPAALERLVKRAEETHSDALIVLKDGKLVGEWRFGKSPEPIESMSVTKPMVNLAIGRLVTTRKLRIDEPAATFYPEWKGTPREKITVHHLLAQTSGLQAQPGATEIYESRDIVRLALDAPLVSEPGEVFFYNNKAVNLLGGIVQKISGKKLDEFMRDEVFAPLGMARFSWMRDEAGNPHCMAGLKIDPLDLAKIGQLMLDEGSFQGRRILTPEWVHESVRPGEGAALNGLLWRPLAVWTKREMTDETLEIWRRGGADPAFLEKMATLRGKLIDDDELPATLDGLFGTGKGLQAYMNVRTKGLPGLKIILGPVIGFYGNGDLGQNVAVLSAPRLVAVRMIRRQPLPSAADHFGDFFQKVRELGGDGAHAG